MKVFLISISVLVIAGIILILIIKSKNNTIQNKNKQIENLQKQIREKETQYNYLNKEMEIEKRFNKELTEKLAAISNMSINDVLRQLQDDSNSRKNNNLHS